MPKKKLNIFFYFYKFVDYNEVCFHYKKIKENLNLVYTGCPIIGPKLW